MSAPHDAVAPLIEPITFLAAAVVAVPLAKRLGLGSVLGYIAAGVAVFGVNPASAEKHKKFVAKHNLRTPLLVDSKGATSKAYDALMPIPLITLINRTVVGIDRDGIIRFYERGMPSTSTILAAMAPASAAT